MDTEISHSLIQNINVSSLRINIYNLVSEIKQMIGLKVQPQRKAHSGLLLTH